MKLLVVLALVGTAVSVLRNPDARRWVIAMVRSGAVLTNLAKSDFGTIQRQVLLGARRQRCVAVNGVTRLPTAFRVTIAESDRVLVEPVEAAFFGDVAEMLLAEANDEGWIVDGPPRFTARYSDQGRPGFPSVEAVGLAARVAVPRAPDRAAGHDREREGTRPYDDGPATEACPRAKPRSSLVLREVGTKRSIALPPSGDERLSIGRNRRCDILLDDPAVSSRHARLDRGAEGWTLVDSGSTNGTFVNDRAAATPTLLQPGDVVRFGPDMSFFVSA